ncbi:MAG: cyclic nucleotide-binding domain-containing protein [Deltaproteobacteria bacterium]|nr:cyclic nucleotide-binding domain-containing protein [Deltaproteobacteria bacterium]
METLEPILAAHPFFRDLDPRHLQLIVSCAANVRFEAGQFIFREGEDANHFYLLRHGTVSVEVFVPQRGALTIQTLREGDVLGWSWLLPPYRWHFDARAVSLTRALALDGKCLRAKCEDDHDLGYELFKRFARLMTERLQATRLQLLDVYGGHQ